MIRYSLICDAEHVFESWFPNSESFEQQAKRGFVTCPECGSAKVSKAMMAPRVRTAEKAEEMAARRAPVPAPASPAAPVASPQDAEMRAMLRALRDHVRANAENVGDKFPETARKMHYGEIERRSIYGQSTLEDAIALREEGIEVHPLPILPDDRN